MKSSRVEVGEVMPLRRRMFGVLVMDGHTVRCRPGKPALSG